MSRSASAPVDTGLPLRLLPAVWLAVSSPQSLLVPSFSVQRSTLQWMQMVYGFAFFGGLGVHGSIVIVISNGGLGYPVVGAVAVACILLAPLAGILTAAATQWIGGPAGALMSGTPMEQSLRAQTLVLAGLACLVVPGLGGPLMIGLTLRAVMVVRRTGSVRSLLDAAAAIGCLLLGAAVPSYLLVAYAAWVEFGSMR